MKRILLFSLFIVATIAATAQGLVKGKVLDKKTDTPLGFVNVRVSSTADSKLVGGGMTDADGNFSVAGLKNGKYTLSLSFMGYKEEQRQ